MYIRLALVLNKIVLLFYSGPKVVFIVSVLYGLVRVICFVESSRYTTTYNVVVLKI